MDSCENKIIDSHVHLLRVENYNTGIFEENGMDIPENTPIEHLVSALRSVNVTRAVIMGQKMERVWDSECGEEYVFEAYEGNKDFFVPFMSIEPVTRTGTLNRKELNRLIDADENDLAGILITPPYGQFHSNDNRVYPFYEIAQERNLVVQFHHSANTGEKLIFAHHKFISMSSLNDILIDFPDLKVVIEHLGYPWTEELFTLMACTENLYADLALLFDKPTLTAWKLVMAKEYNVVDRILYGSDYYSFDAEVSGKMRSYIEYLRSGVNEICRKSGWPELSDDDISGILYKNASNLYQIF